MAIWKKYSRDLFDGTVLVFAWSNWENHINVRRISGSPAEFRVVYLRNTVQNLYHYTNLLSRGLLVLGTSHKFHNMVVCWSVHVDVKMVQHFSFWMLSCAAFRLGHSIRKYRNKFTCITTLIYFVAGYKKASNKRALCFWEAIIFGGSSCSCVAPRSSRPSSTPVCHAQRWHPHLSPCDHLHLCALIGNYRGNIM
jgi:hypothetical protein